jgi:hypothetical protein
MADLFAVKAAVVTYGHAVQEADVDQLRSITVGAMQEPYSFENAEQVGAQLVSDAFVYGAITISEFRDAYFAPTECRIAATVRFERSTPLRVQFNLLKQDGTWLISAARTLACEVEPQSNQVRRIAL